ncbi:unnamed protein product [Darwinula stevensoni]|uniref:Uncharacterized protein n=1 Tax=Darwinula stevensoni TaxID=69355 RepID=A0A7R9AFV4_9CRUS|nr:unnamed protein product [Darwinula stevensoni]CAG0903232.1 unnamed protein product [Darwinula stevensoni]
MDGREGMETRYNVGDNSDYRPGDLGHHGVFADVQACGNANRLKEGDDSEELEALRLKFEAVSNGFGHLEAFTCWSLMLTTAVDVSASISAYYFSFSALVSGQDMRTHPSPKILLALLASALTIRSVEAAGPSLQACLHACASGTAAVWTFCSSIQSLPVKAACWEVGQGRPTQCKGFCYRYFP